MSEKKQEVETFVFVGRCSSKQNLHLDESLLGYDTREYL
jgi:hypothetical protein